MRAELVKRQDRWDLYAEGGSKIGSSAPNPMNKLSLKNCEEIYDGNNTEYNVEIEMEQYVKYVPKSLATVYPTGGVRPKLDADGCLILKRKV